jgi:hypothetical protein
LVFHLMDGDYPCDSSGEPLINCTEFRQFWQSFVDEPIDQLMSRLPTLQGRHKLQNGDYIRGFVSGAIGLAEQVRQRLKEEWPVRPSVEPRFNE